MESKVFLEWTDYWNCSFCENLAVHWFSMESGVFLDWRDYGGWWWSEGVSRHHSGWLAGSGWFRNLPLINPSWSAFLTTDLPWIHCCKFYIWSAFKLLTCHWHTNLPSYFHILHCCYSAIYGVSMGNSWLHNANLLMPRDVHSAEVLLFISYFRTRQ